MVEARGIVLDTLGIRLWIEGVLEADMQVLKQVNVDVSVLQERNLTNGIHARQGAGYAVWEIEAGSRHQGVIALVWREDSGLQVDGIVNFGPNMASFFMTSGYLIWYVVRDYDNKILIPLYLWW